MNVSGPQVEPPRPGNEPPVFTKAYDALLWLVEESHRFPHGFRNTLVQRLHEAGIGLVLHLTAARFGGAGRAAALARADVEVDKLRVLLRLSKDLRLLSIKKYLAGAERLREVGKMIGGWKRTQQGAG